MIPIIQRPNECTLASICILNGFSQKDYLAVSDLCKEAGVRWLQRSETAFQTRQIALRICEGLGLVIPKGYRILDRSYGDRNPDFRGKGIVHISWIPYRHRQPRGHALTFDNGKFTDTDGTVYANWDALVSHFTNRRDRNVRCTNIYRL